MTILAVEKPGLLTTVQDLGRRGFQAYGMPASGAVDDYSFQVSNILVGNPLTAAALEMTLAGGAFNVLEEGIMAVTGAEMEPKINGAPAPMWEAINIKAGDTISFGLARSGCRTYLALAGGIDVPEVMGSRSTYVRCRIGGVEGRPLERGDHLKSLSLNICHDAAGRRLPGAFIPQYTAKWEVRVILGPQDDYFTPKGIKSFLGGEYAVANDSDRMGCRLEGPKIEHGAGADIISDGVPHGAVQVPGNGQPIVMLADRQTTGGYAKIATVISSDIWKIAQAKPGDAIRFYAVSLEEGHLLHRLYKEQLNLIYKLFQTNFANMAQYRLRMDGRIYEIAVHASP